MRFTSTVYKQLVVHELDVIFVNGEAEVTDDATAGALRELPADHSVCGRHGPHPPGEPSQANMEYPASPVLFASSTSGGQ